MSAPLSPQNASWLSLVRYQAVQAVEQSRKPMPAAALAINHLQDTIESFLRLCTEHLPATLAKNRQDFLQLFDAVDDALAGRITHYRGRLDALNKARVGFKHSGNLPDITTIERHRVNTVDFLDEACLLALGQGFDTVSLTGFISDADARRWVEAAESEWAAGDRVEAMGSLRLAFDRLVEDYEERKVWYPGRSLFSTRPSFLHNVDSKLEEWIKAIDERTKLLALGVDLRRYAFFDAHAPSVVYTMDGQHHLYARQDGLVLTADVYERSYRFVIDTALLLGAEDYDFDFDAWRTERYNTEVAVNEPAAMRLPADT